MLEVRDLVVFYENALALNGLSISIGKHEVVGVFGSNSAGKTTLLNTIAGLTSHLRERERRRGGMRITVTGEIVFSDREISQLSTGSRVGHGIVLCRERHPIFRDCTVEENLRLGGYLRPQGELRASLDEVYALFPPLVALRKQRAGMLSGGEQEMVAIGTALAARPALLLLDEPLLGLSPRVQDKVVRAIREISRRGTTILVAEQYARPVLPVVDRAYVIENGALVVGGTGAELLANPEVKSAYFGVG